VSCAAAPELVDLCSWAARLTEGVSQRAIAVRTRADRSSARPQTDRECSAVMVANPGSGNRETGRIPSRGKTSSALRFGKSAKLIDYHGDYRPPPALGPAVAPPPAAAPAAKLPW